MLPAGLVSSVRNLLSKLVDWECLISMSGENSEETAGVHSTETLLPRVYDELRRLAAYRINQHTPGQTISGTALVHEAYLRLSKEGDGPRWANQSQFFSAAAEAMRRIMIDRIRSKNRTKRGGDYERINLDQAEISFPNAEGKLFEIDEALDELTEVDPDSAELVKLRFFAGLTLEEIATLRQVSSRTVTRQWAYARAWLAQFLAET